MLTEKRAGEEKEKEETRETKTRHAKIYDKYGLQRFPPTTIDGTLKFSSNQGRDSVVEPRFSDFFPASGM
jgi:hypothetical protein